MVILSFLFFGRRQDLYSFLLCTGLLFSSGFYLTVLFGRLSKKTKVIWTIVIFISIILQWLTEPILFDSSCKIFISKNRAHAPSINSMLQDKPDGIFICTDTIIDPSKTLNTNDKSILYNAFGKLDGVSVVVKEKKYIYYGFDSSRHGVIYWTDKSKPDMHYRHLVDNWYR